VLAEIHAVEGLAENKEFLKNAYAKIGRKKSKEKGKESFTTKDIEQVETWAVGLLRIQGVRPSLSPTKDIRIAQTLFGLEIQEEHELAEEKCASAQDLGFNFFEATLFLSKIFEENGNQKRALNELSKIRPYIQSLEFKGKYPTRWQDELDRFWRLCIETNSPKHALPACRDLSDQPDSDAAGYIAQAQEWMIRAKDLRSIPSSSKLSSETRPQQATEELRRCNIRIHRQRDHSAPALLVRRLFDVYQQAKRRPS
jgi:hypothetical protein